MTLGTTVALPVVRGPVPLAKTLGALDHLSQGRLFVGVGPGSSPRDYEAVGVPFEERWKRLEEGVKALRSLWRREGGEAFVGEFTLPRRSGWSPIPTNSPGRLFGWEVGAPMLDSAAQPVSETAGWPRPTIPHRRHLRWLGPNFGST